jgi:hypothetical protein
MKPGGSKPGTSSSTAGRKTRSPTRKESGEGLQSLDVMCLRWRSRCSPALATAPGCSPALRRATHPAARTAARPQSLRLPWPAVDPQADCRHYIDGVNLCRFNLIDIGKYCGAPRENDDLFRLGSRWRERPGAIDKNVRHLSAPHRQSSRWSDDAPRHLGRCEPRSIARQGDRLPPTLRSARYASSHVRSVLARGVYIEGTLGSRGIPPGQ